MLLRSLASNMTTWSLPAAGTYRNEKQSWPNSDLEPWKISTKLLESRGKMEEMFPKYSVKKYINNVHEK